MAAELTVAVIEEQLRKEGLALRGFGVRSLAVFGSVARAAATASSDLDFLVEFEGAATFDRYMGLKFFLEDLFEIPVDLVLTHTLKPQIRQTVLAEAIHLQSADVEEPS